MLLHTLGTLSCTVSGGKAPLTRTRHVAQILSMEKFNSSLMLKSSYRTFLVENNFINHLYSQAKECSHEKMLLFFEIKIGTQVA